MKYGFEGDGGNWGEGWDSDDGDESGPWKIENMWAWQIICIGSLLQVLLEPALLSRFKNNEFVEMHPSGQSQDRLRLGPRHFEMRHKVLWFNAGGSVLDDAATSELRTSKQARNQICCSF